MSYKLVRYVECNNITKELVLQLAVSVCPHKVFDSALFIALDSVGEFRVILLNLFEHG